jgi:hypothetical protein
VRFAQDDRVWVERKDQVEVIGLVPNAVALARDAHHTTPTDKERQLGARLSDDEAVTKMGHPAQG